MLRFMGHLIHTVASRFQRITLGFENPKLDIEEETNVDDNNNKVSVEDQSSAKAETKQMRRREAGGSFEGRERDERTPEKGQTVKEIEQKIHGDSIHR